MADLDLLAEAINDSLTRAERAPDSRNRPISLYLTVNDAIQITEDSVTLTTSTGPWVWYDGSTGPPRLSWGLGVWESP